MRSWHIASNRNYVDIWPTKLVRVTHTLFKSSKQNTHSTLQPLTILMYSAEFNFHGNFVIQN